MRNVDDLAVTIADIFDDNPGITCGSFKIRMRNIQSDFFKMNALSRDVFADQIFHAVEGIREKPQVKVSIKKDCEFVAVDDIDSFKKVHSIGRQEIRAIDLEEGKIKQALAAIIGERFVQKDWGGERSDLFTSRLILRGRRCLAAFMLKGRGIPRKLTIADCGKNGDQVLRLIKEPAEIFVVQHIREIDSSVVDLLARLVAEKSLGGNKLFYSVMDGIDTVRILLAYKKLAVMKTRLEVSRVHPVAKNVPRRQ